MNLIFKILLGLVLLAPVPFGSYNPWAWTVLAVGVGLLVISWSVLSWISGEAPPVSVAKIWPSAVMFGLVLLWIMLQTATWTPVFWHHPIFSLKHGTTTEMTCSLGGCLVEF